MNSVRMITFGLDEMSSFEVGVDGVTEIRYTEKSGSMAALPYFQVWKGDKLHSEHCQHNLTGTYYQ